LTITLEGEIDELLARHTAPTRKLALKVIGLVREIRPDLTPKVQRGWGSVNFRHPKAGFVCGVFPQAKEKNVILVFERGRELDSPLLVDNGKVRQVRWIPFVPGQKIPVDDIAILLAEAIALRS
jgi:hypothetical protein